MKVLLDTADEEQRLCMWCGHEIGPEQALIVTGKLSREGKERLSFFHRRCYRIMGAKGYSGLWGLI
jgi:hypothetical protein